MQGVLGGSEGAAISMAGDGVGGNVVNALFASTISQAAMSGDKLGLADMIFRSIQAKQQHAETVGGQGTQAAPLPPTPQPASVPPTAPTSAGYPLAPYWQSNGLRPLAA